MSDSMQQLTEIGRNKSNGDHHGPEFNNAPNTGNTTNNKIENVILPPQPKRSIASSALTGSDTPQNEMAETIDAYLKGRGLEKEEVSVSTRPDGKYEVKIVWKDKAHSDPSAVSESAGQPVIDTNGHHLP